MKNLTLYHFEGCPYCSRVTNYLKQNNITLSIKDTLKDPNAKDELVKIGGKSQVPCLVIDGKALYESLDIIEWFKKNWKNG
ncbi:MAG: glutathione S-transferase N-terminal domain-containing protein [Candidatus Omnitrophota bacterium]